MRIWEPDLSDQDIEDIAKSWENSLHAEEFRPSVFARVFEQLGFDEDRAETAILDFSASLQSDEGYEAHFARWNLSCIVARYGGEHSQIAVWRNVFSGRL
jgi:hypothetical protein